MARSAIYDDPVCDHCGVPFSLDYGEGVVCPSCIATKPVFDRARAAVVYDDVSHDLVVRFKHSDRTDLAPMLARWVARAGAPLLTGDPILTPVPLHPMRMAARRFNQSAVLVNEIARQTGVRKTLDAVTRVRRTPPQQSLSADARQRNVAGAFAVEKKCALIENANVVIVDDVLTTGATLSAVARALKRAGAARVSALVIARVVKGDVRAI